MSDDSLTARNRINQRNFRARRQNYIKELEERIRKYESDGVQATIEIQAAARQVTDQNTKLRNLLVQRFGMSEYEISNYLGFQQQSPLIHNQPFSNAFAPISQLTSLAPAPSGGLAPKSQSSAEVAHQYPTPPQQSDLPRPLTSAHLDPALSLASLHKYTSTAYESRTFPEPTPTNSRHNSDHSMTQTMAVQPSPYDSRPPDSPTDTLSESSNPSTPAEQMQVDNPRSAQPQAQPQSAPASCCKPSPQLSTTPVACRRNDETACEEAARIIASMRGGSDANPDQVMLELGCSDPETNCKVKNLSIFQLMDRG